jgi:hypothetical protein
VTSISAVVTVSTPLPVVSLLSCSRPSWPPSDLAPDPPEAPVVADEAFVVSTIPATIKHYIILFRTIINSPKLLKRTFGSTESRRYLTLIFIACGHEDPLYILNENKSGML